MHTQTQQAAAWWAQPRGEVTASWVANYQDSLGARHRQALVNVVAALKPASVLELGSHCGPNLVRLAQAIPDIPLTGVDANAGAIAAGTAWMQSLGLGDRVELVAGTFPDATSPLENGCVDVVMTCYALAYVAPFDLDAVLYECGRLAAKAVVIAEPTAVNTESRGGMSGYTEWAHPYTDSFKWVGTLRGWTVTTHAIEPPVDRLNQITVLTC